MGGGRAFSSRRAAESACAVQAETEPTDDHAVTRLLESLDRHDTPRRRAAFNRFICQGDIPEWKRSAI